jgi:5'-3' exonuclease
MVEFEADDALASAAAKVALDPRADRVVICTPDKDLAQCVRGTRVVQMNRRTRTVFDEAGIIAKFGVPPVSIPDYLALVGDAADGYPGLRGWGAKSAAAVLARYGYLESIPENWRTWGVNAASPGSLALTLARERDRAFLFRDLATLRSHLSLFDSVDDLYWNGPTPAFAPLAARLDASLSALAAQHLRVTDGYLMPAFGTLPAPLRYGVRTPVSTARASETLRPATRRQIPLAGLFGRELTLKLAHILRKRRARHAPTLQIVAC